MSIIGIIPARYASTRFPGKPLIDIGGKTMLQRVYEQAQKTTLLQKIIVATDDKRIFDHVIAFGGEAIMTASHHQSGTDRCAEIVHKIKKASIIVNIQGDEPFIAPSQIEKVIEILQNDRKAEIATLVKKIEKIEDLYNHNVVKAIFNKNNYAIYFSRQTIPFLRNIEKDAWLAQNSHYKHIGMYAFRRKALLSIAQLSPSFLEKMESLEQLRWLENDYKIKIGETELETIGIDTPEDLAKNREIFI